MGQPKGLSEDFNWLHGDPEKSGGPLQQNQPEQAPRQAGDEPWRTEKDKPLRDINDFSSQRTAGRTPPPGYTPLSADEGEYMLRHKGSTNDALFEALGVSDPFSAATASKDAWKRALKSNPWLLRQYGNDEYGDLLGVKYDANGAPIWDEAAFDNWYDTLTGKYKLGDIFDNSDTYDYVMRSEYSLPTASAYGDALAEFLSSQGLGGEGLFEDDNWFWTLGPDGQVQKNQSNIDRTREALDQLFLRNFLGANASNPEKMQSIAEDLPWLLGQKGEYSIDNIPDLSWGYESDVPDGYQAFGPDYSGTSYDYDNFTPEVGYTDKTGTTNLVMEDLPYLLQLYVNSLLQEGQPTQDLYTVARKYSEE